MGLIKQHKLVNSLLNDFDIKTVSPVPSAWDEIFSKLYSGYIIVILKDKTVIKGLLHCHSYIGDEIKDLYLEKVYYKKGKNEWYSDKVNAGIYISSDEISRIEFLKEVSDEK